MCIIVLDLLQQQILHHEHQTFKLHVHISTYLWKALTVYRNRGLLFISVYCFGRVFPNLKPTPLPGKTTYTGKSMAPANKVETKDYNSMQLSVDVNINKTNITESIIAYL